MPKVRSILMVSNGHGEDIIGAALLKNLLSRNEGIWVRVLPIVGEGNAYKDLPVKILGPRKNLPTGGFMRQSVKNFWIDLQAGLLKNTYDQIQILRELRKEVDMVICVGDILLVMLVGWFMKKPMVFLPTAKSEYISGHYKSEKKLMRKYADLVLPRDAKTAEILQKAGIPAQFVGNAMMDSFLITDCDFGIEPDTKVVGILPGSRAEAYQNMSVILKVVENLEELKVQEMEYIVALANQISIELLERTANGVNWVMVTNGSFPKGVVAILCSPKGSKVKLTKGVFGDVLVKSDIFIGLAGTANEQAVGIGKPLVAFPGEGPQFNKKFLSAQKRLLGDSISVVEPVPEKVAEELLVILHDPVRYDKMGEIGRERMGPPGGIGRMAELILEKLSL